MRARSRSWRRRRRRRSWSREPECRSLQNAEVRMRKAEGKHRCLPPFCLPHSDLCIAMGTRMRALSEVYRSVATNPDAGLSHDGVAASRQRYGGNHLTPLPREPLWKKFIEKFDEPIIQILLAAALLSMFVD